MHPHLGSALAGAGATAAAAVLGALPTISDIACASFALWTLPALWRVLLSRKVAHADPLRVVALLLISGRYGFTFDRWAFGMHVEAMTHAEMIGRQGAFLWSIATIAVAALVIRGYGKMV